MSLDVFLAFGCPPGLIISGAIPQASVSIPKLQANMKYLQRSEPRWLSDELDIA
jgi:hypothetical protein